MRFLLVRTDAMGDLLVSLPVQARILSRDPRSEIHWLVSPYTAPLLENVAERGAIHIREAGMDLAAYLKTLRLDAVLNLSHRDRAITVAAKTARVPVRVARARGLDQILAATHVLWKGRRGTGCHEAQHALDFLRPWGWQGGVPVQVPLVLGEAEKAQGEADLCAIPRPRLGVILRGSGAGAFPSQGWWDKALPSFAQAGWHPVVLSPPDASTLAPTEVRGLMARLHGCDAIVSPSTGPAHLAAGLGVPVVALMGKRIHHGPDRWTPLGARVQVVTYPGDEADLTGGMDRLRVEEVISHLGRFR